MSERERPEDDLFVFSYSAEQAMDDGILIPVDTKLCKEAGYHWPVRITQGVASLVTPAEAEQSEGQSVEGRMWDTLWVARVAIMNAETHEQIVPFEVMFGGNTETLWACLDSTSGPAIHIIRPEEY